MKNTQRGFDLIEFVDRYDVKCSLQKSSLATEDCIWLGANKVEIKEMVENEGWKDVILPDNMVQVGNRMHLTREQVAYLLPYLQKFVNTGELS